MLHLNECFFIMVVYFVIDSVRKLLDTPSYIVSHNKVCIYIIHYEMNYA